MKKIEVEWDTSPKSGITNIDLKDLGCKQLSQWTALSKEEQTDRLAKAIKEYDLGTLKFIPRAWDYPANGD